MFLWRTAFAAYEIKRESFLNNPDHATFKTPPLSPRWQAAAAVYPGLDSLSLREARKSGSRGPPAPSSLAGIVADVVYPRVVEALLSAAGPSPCCPGERRCGAEKKAAVGLVSEESSAAPGAATVSAAAADVPSDVGGVAGGRGISGGDGYCRCYPSADSEVAEERAKRGGSKRRQRGQHHDPWEALEALRPAQPPQPPPSSSGGAGGSGGASGAGTAPSESFSLGAVLLLCEVLRCEEIRLSKSTSLRVGECCAWMLDHLSFIFSTWVETAAAVPNAAGAGEEGSSWRERERVVRALCQEAASALGCYVSRRAVQGGFEAAQVGRGDRPAGARDGPEQFHGVFLLAGITVVCM